MGPTGHALKSPDDAEKHEPKEAGHDEDECALLVSSSFTDSFTVTVSG